METLVSAGTALCGKSERREVTHASATHIGVSYFHIEASVVQVHVLSESLSDKVSEDRVREDFFPAEVSESGGIEFLLLCLLIFVSDSTVLLFDVEFLIDVATRKHSRAYEYHSKGDYGFNFCSHKTVYVLLA